MCVCVCLFFFWGGGGGGGSCILEACSVSLVYFIRVFIWWGGGGGGGKFISRVICAPKGWAKEVISSCPDLHLSPGINPCVEP